jgi:cyclopropane fatty-acyl-phospholipid synthase-like methyltransferase
MYVAAECFRKTSITGIDLFKHGSVAGMSMEKAAKNMKALGLDSRTSFLKHDLTTPMKSEADFDLVISNLAFHNIGKKRLKAYETVFDVLKPKGFLVIGDLFPHERTDMNYFRQRSTLIREVDEGSSGPWAYKIKVLRKQ